MAGGVSRDVNLNGVLDGARERAESLAAQVRRVREDVSETSREVDVLGQKVGEVEPPQVLGVGVPDEQRVPAPQVVQPWAPPSHVDLDANEDLRPGFPPGPVTQAQADRAEFSQGEPVMPMTQEYWLEAYFAKEGIQPLSDEEMVPLRKAMGERPDPKRHRNPAPLDTPGEHQDKSEDWLHRRAAQLWSQFREGGASYQLQAAGDYGRAWGGWLKGDMAKEQREFADAAASPAGRDYMAAREEMAAIGQKILALQEAIKGGGEEAVKAASDLKKAKEALEEVGKSGRDAADRLGGTMGGRLHEDMKSLQEDIKVGNIARTEGDDGAKAPGLSGHHLWSIARNPQGAAMGLADMVGPALMERMANGGGGAWDNLVRMATRPMGAGATAAGLAVGVPAAIYAGWKFTEGRAKDRLDDAGEHIRDTRIGMDAGFDLRGLLYDKDRMHYGEHGLNVAELRHIIPAMGIGFKTFKGGPMDGAQSAQRIWESAEGMGLDPTTLASFVGRHMTSGAVERSEDGVTRLLSQMNGYLKEARDAGVTSSEALGALAQLGQRQVEALGKLSPEGQKFHANLLHALQKTGDPSFKGEQGAKAAMDMMSPIQADNTLAMLMSEVPDMGRFLQRHFGEDAKLYKGADIGTIAEAIRNHPTAPAELRRRARMPGGKLHGISPLLQRRFLGQEGTDMTRFMKEDGLDMPGHSDEAGWDGWVKRFNTGAVAPVDPRIAMVASVAGADMKNKKLMLEEMGVKVDKETEQALMLMQSQAKGLQSQAARAGDRDRSQMGMDVAEEFFRASSEFKDGVDRFSLAVNQMVEGKSPTPGLISSPVPYLPPLPAPPVQDHDAPERKAWQMAQYARH